MAVVGSWTYSGDPADSNLDAVRFLIGDTDDCDQQISNEEITYLLSVSGGVYAAAASAASAIAASFASLVDKSVGDLSISYGQRQDAYEALSARLQAGISKGLGATVAPFSGGISRSDKQTQEQDTDWDDPAFRIGVHDHVGTDQHAYITSTST